MMKAHWWMIVVRCHCFSFEMDRIKKIFSWVVLFLSLGNASWAQDPLAQFEDLYPGCVDNQESPIYGGTYGKWPKELNLPEFPGGGDVQLTRYVYDNMEYPEVVESYDTIAATKEVVPVLAKGIVAVQVVIDRCGRPSRAEVIQSVNEAYDAEALRIVSGMPTFKPGDYMGERVKVALIVPVRFTRNKMPPPPESEYGDYWGDGGDSYDDYSDDSSDDGGYDSYSKYDDVQWDDSW